MNNALRKEHFLRITDKRARHMYDRVCDACDRRPEGITDADQMLAADIAYAEQIKQMLMDDVAQRGIGQERYNGRQKYWQENKSLAQYRAFAEQQRKHLGELKLTAAKRQAAPVEIDDDFDTFPD
jgi:hypothetical protein